MQKHDTPFPVRGDNFDTVAILDGDHLSLDQLEAVSFLNDCQVAMKHFHQQPITAANDHPETSDD